VRWRGQTARVPGIVAPIGWGVKGTMRRFSGVGGRRCFLWGGAVEGGGEGGWQPSLGGAGPSREKKKNLAGGGLEVCDLRVDWNVGLMFVVTRTSRVSTSRLFRRRGRPVWGRTRFDLGGSRWRF